MLIETWSLDVVNVTLFGTNTADNNGAKVKAILYSSSYNIYYRMLLRYLRKINMGILN